MMYLVKVPPEEIDRMTPPVPPVEDKGGNEVRDHAAGIWIHVVGQMNQRIGRQPFFPRDPGKKHNPELYEIHTQHANRPGGNFRKFPAWKCTLQHKAKTEDDKNCD